MLTSAARGDTALAAMARQFPVSPGIVFTQIAPAASRTGVHAENARLLLLDWSGKTRVLSQGFHSAADPDVSFDGRRILFAGRRNAADRWQIYEINADGTGLRRITNTDRDCRHPIYQSRIFTLDAPTPWYQVAFASGGALYSAKLDGSSLEQLTHTPSEALEPAIIRDGRIIYSVRDPGRQGPGPLFGINLDGTDFALFNGEGNAQKRMPAATEDGWLIFVETAAGRADGAGSLARVNLDRPLRSRRIVTRPGEGLYHSPSGLPGGGILVSRATTASFGLWRMDPASGKQNLLLDDPRADEIQARLVAPRPEPDGRGSVVDKSVPWGVLYGLNVYTNDLTDPAAMPPGSVKSLRVLQAVPGAAGVQDRQLGEAPVQTDGSFHVKIPANMPVRLQLMDANRKVIRSGAWIYVRNKEMRGCIGCHEDGELTPENREAIAITKPAIDLTHHNVSSGGAR